MAILDDIVRITVRNRAGEMAKGITIWEATALARLLIAECRRRERARWDALPAWKKAWRRLLGRGFR